MKYFSVSSRSFIDCWGSRYLRRYRRRRPRHRNNLENSTKFDVSIKSENSLFFHTLRRRRSRCVLFSVFTTICFEILFCWKIVLIIILQSRMNWNYFLLWIFELKFHPKSEKRAEVEKVAHTVLPLASKIVWYSIFFHICLDNFFLPLVRDGVRNHRCRFFASAIVEVFYCFHLRSSKFLNTIFPLHYYASVSIAHNFSITIHQLSDAICRLEVISLLIVPNVYVNLIAF